MKCILKKFGILSIDKDVKVECRYHPNKEFVYVFYGNGWHTVPIQDVKVLE